MTKLMTVLAAAFFAVTVLCGSGAEAGFNVRINAPAGLSLLQKAGCHGGGYFPVYHRRYRIVHHSVKPKVHVARIYRAVPVTIAKVEEPKVEDTVEPATTAATDATENSSISSSDTAVNDSTAKTDNTAATTTDEVAAKTADTTDDVKTPAKADQKKVATTDPGCKAFFPAIGSALTVPCN